MDKTFAANLSEQDGELVYRSAMLGAALATIERQQATIDRREREIARLEATIARMRTDPARRPTRTESIVRGLNALYAFESPEEV